MSRYAKETSPGVWVRERPGRIAIKLSDGAKLGPDPDIGWTDELAALCGYFPIITVERPSNTATTRWERTLADVNGQPSDVWVEHDKTPDELNAEQQQATDAAELAAWLALKPDYIAIRNLPNLVNMNNTERDEVLMEHRRALRVISRGQLRLMRNYE